MDYYASNPERWWFSIWRTGKFYCGWAFGATPEAAASSARRDAERWCPESLRELPSGSGMMTLQRDTRPAVYADFPISQIS